MKRSLKRYLLFISLILLVGGGCTMNRLSLLPVEDPDTITPLDHSFSSPGAEWIYKARIDISETHFSGLFAIRKFPDQTYRVVFLNELGMKFIDFETGSNGLIVHHSVDAFQKRRMQKILEETVNALLLTGSTIEKEKALTSQSGDYTVYPVKTNGREYCFVSNSSGKLVRIVKQGWVSKKMIVEFDDYNHLPGSIHVSFPQRKISFKLSNLK